LSFVCSHKLYTKIVKPCDVILQWLSNVYLLLTSKHVQQVIYKSNWRLIHLAMKFICKWIFCLAFMRWYSFGCGHHIQTWALH
jgi:hypothetical protein